MFIIAYLMLNFEKIKTTKMYTLLIYILAGLLIFAAYGNASMVFKANSDKKEIDSRNFLMINEIEKLRRGFKKKGIEFSFMVTEKLQTPLEWRSVDGNRQSTLLEQLYPEYYELKNPRCMFTVVDGELKKGCFL